MSAKRKKDIEEKYTTDRQEKVELFRQIKCDIHSENEAVCTAAKNKLYDELVGFIGLEINRYFSTYKTEYYEEMMHEAWVGIMENIDDYDPGRSLPTTWAHYAIVHQIKLFINEVSNKSSTHHSLRMNEIKNCIEDFKKRGLTPTVSDISNYTSISVKCVEEELDRINLTKPTSLEAYPVESPSFSDIGQNPEFLYMKNELAERLYKAIDELPSIERNVIKYHFGIGAEEVSSATKIAQKLGINRPEVQTALSRALKKLDSSRYLVGETGNKWEDEKNAHVGQIVLDSINDKEAEEYYSMFHPQEDVVLVVLDDNDDSSSPLTPAKEETDEEIHLVFGA